MGKVIWSDSSRERAWPWRLTGLSVMVVWRSSASRTVNLHTGTMGVHRACFHRSACPSHSPRLRSSRYNPYLSCVTFLDSRTNWRALGIFSQSRSDPYLLINGVIGYGTEPFWTGRGLGL